MSSDKMCQAFIHELHQDNRSLVSDSCVLYYDAYATRCKYCMVVL